MKDPEVVDLLQENRVPASVSFLSFSFKLSLVHNGFSTPFVGLTSGDHGQTWRDPRKNHWRPDSGEK
jgi:hypothetical protein